MNKIFVKPKEGILVRNPAKPGSPFIKSSGEWLQKSRYVIRRLRDGDLLETTPPEVEVAEVTPCETEAVEENTQTTETAGNISENITENENEGGD